MKLLVLVMSLILSMPVFAERYLAGSVGLSEAANSDVDGGSQNAVNRFHLTLAHGWEFDQWRIEVGTNYLPMEFDGHEDTEIETRTHTLLFNAYRDFDHSDKWGTFVGAGIGAAYNKMTVTNIDSMSKYTSAAQLIFGVKMHPHDETELTFDYRVLGFNDGPHEIIHSLNFGLHKHI